MAAYHLLNDIELGSLLKKGDELAFNEIYSRYWKFLYEVAFSVVKDPGSCDDIIQEIFVWVWVNREKHLTDSFKPYLRAAVKYKVANLIRHGKFKNAYFEQNLKFFTESSTTEKSLELKELNEIIAQFTAQLPNRARMIFDLSRNKFLTNKEIAEKLGISEKTVENQMNINLKKLRRSLGRLSFWSTII